MSRASRRNRRQIQNRKQVETVTDAEVSFTSEDLKAYITCDAAAKNVVDEDTCSTASSEEPPVELSEEPPVEPTAPDTPISIASPVLLEVADDQIARGIARVLKAMSQPSKPSAPKNCFQSVKLPACSLKAYASRIHEYFQCSRECWVMALAYIERIIKLNPTFQVTEMTCHRLLLISVAVAVKFQDDEYYSNEYFAKIGGITTKELNALEAEFLQLIGWRLDIQVAEYNALVKTTSLDTDAEATDTEESEDEDATEVSEDEDATPVRTTDDWA